MKKILFLFTFVIALASCQSKDSKLRALIIDGQNNHYIWPKTTLMIKSYLEETNLFSVDITRTEDIWLGIKYNPNRSVALDGYFKSFPIDSTKKNTFSEPPLKDNHFNPDFSKYDVVIVNLGLNAASWTDETKKSFESYMKNGGGLVVLHAANNAWGDWEEYNKMIGLGAWGGRTTASGPYVYYDNNGDLKRDESAGICGSHGPEHEYVVDVRVPDHPITKGLPIAWLHAKDELYDRMRGPAENLIVLATAYSDLIKNDPSWMDNKGSERSEPMLMTVNYGKGRTFHSALGHFDYSMECVGFITTLQRGAEWAATGKVTQVIPEDFPSKNKVSSRKWAQKQ